MPSFRLHFSFSIFVTSLSCLFSCFLLHWLQLFPLSGSNLRVDPDSVSFLSRLFELAPLPHRAAPPKVLEEAFDVVAKEFGAYSQRAVDARVALAEACGPVEGPARQREILEEALEVVHLTLGEESHSCVPVLTLLGLACAELCEFKVGHDLS